MQKCVALNNNKNESSCVSCLFFITINIITVIIIFWLASQFCFLLSPVLFRKNIHQKSVSNTLSTREERENAINIIKID